MHSRQTCQLEELSQKVHMGSANVDHAWQEQIEETLEKMQKFWAELEALHDERHSSMSEVVRGCHEQFEAALATTQAAHNDHRRNVQEELSQLRVTIDAHQAMHAQHSAVLEALRAKYTGDSSEAGALEELQEKHLELQQEITSHRMMHSELTAQIQALRHLHDGALRKDIGTANTTDADGACAERLLEVQEQHSESLWAVNSHRGMLAQHRAELDGLRQDDIEIDMVHTAAGGVDGPRWHVHAHMHTQHRAEGDALGRELRAEFADLAAQLRRDHAAEMEGVVQTFYEDLEDVRRETEKTYRRQLEAPHELQSVMFRTVDADHSDNNVKRERSGHMADVEAIHQEPANGVQTAPMTDDGVLTILTEDLREGASEDEPFLPSERSDLPAGVWTQVQMLVRKELKALQSERAAVTATDPGTPRLEPGWDIVDRQQKEVPPAQQCQSAEPQGAAARWVEEQQFHAEIKTLRDDLGKLRTEVSDGQARVLRSRRRARSDHP